MQWIGVENGKANCNFYMYDVYIYKYDVCMYDIICMNVCCNIRTIFYNIYVMLLFD